MALNDVTQTASWDDPKKLLWLLSPLMPLMLFGFAAAGTFVDGALFWAGPVIVYGLIPLLDWLIGTDTSNPPEDAVRELENTSYYSVIVYAYIPAQYAATIMGAYAAATGGLSAFEFLGLVISVGIANGVGINTAHELGHKMKKLEQWLAKITLAPVAYGHFFVEHNRGHHINVATPNDPASSRMGESFWVYLPRTVIGSAVSAWKLEKTRLTRSGKSVWHWSNHNLQAWAMTVVLFGALTLVFGPMALVFLVVQAVFGFSLLEVINYVEHYGLLRQKNEKGRYERCQPEHSWNSNHIVTNLVLYQLQRHSDHHANPARAYQALRHFEEAPQLPSGYASMMIAAYIPPVWFWLMDKRVAAHYQGDMTKAHIAPAARKRIMARWHRA